MTELEAIPKMHEYITDIYVNCDDRYYVHRFIRYLILLKLREATLSIKSYSSRLCLSIDGRLYIKGIDKYFKSFEEFVNYICRNETDNNKYKDRDITVLSKLYTSTKYRLIDTLSLITESDILEFIDQNYRTYKLNNAIYLSLNIKKDAKVKYTEIDREVQIANSKFTIYVYRYNNIHSEIIFKWNNKKYTIVKDRLLSPNKRCKFLEQTSILESFESALNA
jgi:hypothetical protein